MILRLTSFLSLWRLPTYSLRTAFISHLSLFEGEVREGRNAGAARVVLVLDEDDGAPREDDGPPLDRGPVAGALGVGGLPVEGFPRGGGFDREGGDGEGPLGGLGVAAPLHQGPRRARPHRRAEDEPDGDPLVGIHLALGIDAPGVEDLVDDLPHLRGRREGNQALPSARVPQGPRRIERRIDFSVGHLFSPSLAFRGGALPRALPPPAHG